MIHPSEPTLHLPYPPLLLIKGLQTLPLSVAGIHSSNMKEHLINLLLSHASPPRSPLPILFGRVLLIFPLPRLDPLPVGWVDYWPGSKPTIVLLVLFYLR